MGGASLVELFDDPQLTVNMTKLATTSGRPGGRPPVRRRDPSLSRTPCCSCMRVSNTWDRGRGFNGWR